MAAGCPEFWPRAVDVLVSNATNLMKSIEELLVATEVAAIGQHQYNGELIRRRMSRVRLCAYYYFVGS